MLGEGFEAPTFGLPENIEVGRDGRLWRHQGIVGSHTPREFYR